MSVLLGAQRRAEELSDRSTYLRRGIIEEGEIDVENLELLIVQWVRGCTLQGYKWADLEEVLKRDLCFIAHAGVVIV